MHSLHLLTRAKIDLSYKSENCEQRRFD